MSGLAISVVYFLDAVVALTAAAVVWSRREAHGATSLGVMLGAASFWALCDAIELHMPTVPLKQLVSQIQYIGVIVAAPAYFEAAMVLAGEGARLTRGVRLVVWLVPVASLVLAWTNDAHHWLWTRIVAPAGGSPFATYHYGWWFWVLTAQNYALMFAGSVAMVRGLRQVSRGFRSAMAVVLVATVLPWIGNAAYNLKLGPWPGLNWLTLSLGISGWLLTWVVLRGGLLDLVPQARGALIEMMADAVVVLDRRGVITFSNHVARDTMKLDTAALVGVTGAVSLQTLPVEWRGVRELATRGVSRWLDVRVGPVFDRWGELAGRLVVARDVTVQRHLEREREELIDELRDAVQRVTQLEGLLPICAACRHVRDGDDGWTSVEQYIAAHTPVEFTHGICPDCMARLYPETAEPATSPIIEAWRVR